jgi:hypothetical protein
MPERSLAPGTGRLSRHGDWNSKDITLEHHDARTSATLGEIYNRNTCNSMGASNSMDKDKTMSASNSIANNSRNNCNSMGTSNRMDKDKTMSQAFPNL